jgi:xylulokinase
VRLLREDASPRGAVALAGVGAKVWPDIATAVSVLDDSVPVVAERTTAYQEARHRYDKAALLLGGWR